MAPYGVVSQLLALVQWRARAHARVTLVHYCHDGGNLNSCFYQFKCIYAFDEYLQYTEWLSYMVLNKTMVYDWYIPRLCMVYAWILLILD